MTMLGLHHSIATRKKMSKSRKGKFFSEEYRKKLSDALRGKSKSLEARIRMSKARKGTHPTKETRQKMSESQTGHKGYWLGKHFSLETCKKIGEASKGNQYCKGRILSEEHKMKIRNALKGKRCYLWLGGKSFEPYGLEFNRILKEHIRKRDNYRCRECNACRNDLKRKLDIHHIDYNKKNNKPKNLISLCISCHTKTNFLRNDWTKHFEERMCQVCSI